MRFSRFLWLYCLIAMPSAALAQSSKLVFLDCKIAARYERTNSTESADMSLKIDLNRSYVYEFDNTTLKYKNICPPDSVYVTYCKVSDGEFMAIRNLGISKNDFSKSDEFQDYLMVSINRVSGVMFGKKIFRIGDEVPSEFWLNGICQSGSDKTSIKRKF